MRKFLIIFTILFAVISQIFSCEISYSYGVRVQKDYRFTTQQDRNKRIKAYQEYLENEGIFDEDHYARKEAYKKYRKDEDSRANLNHIKHGKPLPKKGYTVKGNYYKMADKILSGYSIIYDDNPDVEYVYNTLGDLYQVIVLTGEEHILPHYKTVYAFNGYLQRVIFSAIDGYDYIFLPTGNLQGVVVDGKLYNKVGRPVKVWLK